MLCTNLAPAHGKWAGTQLNWIKRHREWHWNVSVNRFKSPLSLMRWGLKPPHKHGPKIAIIIEPPEALGREKLGKTYPST